MTASSGSQESDRDADSLPGSGRRLLLTGASGFVGNAIHPVLTDQGWQVRCASRDAAAAARKFPGRDWVDADVADREAVVRSLDGCDAALYLVHGMASSSGDYRREEVEQARNFIESAERAGTEIGEYLIPIIHERRIRPKDDIISLLTQVELEGDRLDDEDILGFCRNLFPAAIDTSTNSLGSLLSHVLPNRELWKRLAHDHDLREDVIQELLRFEPPLVMIPRRATRDIEVGGHTIRAGDDVRLCITGAHDDPKVDRFDAASHAHAEHRPDERMGR